MKRGGREVRTLRFSIILIDCPEVDVIYGFGYSRLHESLVTDTCPCLRMVRGKSGLGLVPASSDLRLENPLESTYLICLF